MIGSSFPSEDNTATNPAQVQSAASAHRIHLVTPVKIALPNRYRKAMKATESRISAGYLENATPHSIANAR